MSETWKVHLVYKDARSNKFWRGRVDGRTMVVNYGRVGSDGQTSVKDFSSAAEADEALNKQADSKRKKGYADTDMPAKEAAPPPPPVAPTEPQSVVMVLDKGGRAIELTLGYDGQVVTTQVAETYDSAGEAAAAFVRILQALQDEGYRKR